MNDDEFIVLEMELLGPALLSARIRGRPAIYIFLGTGMGYWATPGSTQCYSWLWSEVTCGAQGIIFSAGDGTRID